MAGRLGSTANGGDGNTWELTRACAPCDGTGAVPPRNMHAVAQNAPNTCAACGGSGARTQRFKTVDEVLATARAWG